MSDSDSPENNPSEKGKLPRKAKILKPFDAIRRDRVYDAIAEDIARDAERVERGEPPLVTEKRLTKAERKAAERTLNEVRELAGLPPIDSEKKGDSSQWMKKTGKRSGKTVSIDKPKER